jgi:hypothetical protein
VTDSQDTKRMPCRSSPCAVHVRNPYRLHSNHGYFPYSHGYTRQQCLHVGVIEHAIYLPSRCRGTWNDPFLKTSCTTATFHKSSNSRRILLRFCQFLSAAPLFSTVFGPQRSRMRCSPHSPQQTARDCGE